MGTHMRVLIKSFPMNTNIKGFRSFSKDLCVIVLWAKVGFALALAVTSIGSFHRFLPRHHKAATRPNSIGMLL